MQVVGGTIKVNNVNDFIMPNLKCVAGAPAPQTETATINNIRIHSTKKKEGDVPPPKPIKVTLSDCLSCTGCLTSSEELFQAQDVEQFTRGLESDSKIKVVTLSPQAIVSLAVKTGLSPEQVAVGVSNFLKSIGVDYIIDSSIAREITKAQIYEDFKKPGRKGPLVTGVCPGVVSFAEKNEPKTLMPQLSVTRSPMLITGALVKENLSKELGIKPSEIYHACVMPCFDKKLEAFRPDAKFSDGTQLVDCVVATVEFVTVIPEDLTPYLQPSDKKLTWYNTLEHEIVQGTCGATTSGSYAEYVVAQIEHDYPQVNCEKKKMYEGIEFHFFDKVSGFEKRIAVMNGYRNFQRAISQIKGEKSKYDFIELMACPSGCANGAGQIKAENPMEQKKLLEKVTDLYNSLPENDEFKEAYIKVLNKWRSVNPEYSSFVYATYEAARVNDLIEAANAW
uniref:Iron hydrogenase large subunit C-terminal domain-containing protein n=1 Tax=Panagrolaimus sp. ES5 TaxID=591445 RepID=A0AC34F4F4_9BILA